MKFSEKISKKNPPKKAATIPFFFWDFSSKLKVKRVIKIKLGMTLEKWIKKLIWNKDIR